MRISADNPHLMAPLAGMTEQYVSHPKSEKQTRP